MKPEEEAKALTMYPLEGKYEQLPPMLSPSKGVKRASEPKVEKLEAAVLQYKSDGSGSKEATRKRDRKRIKKLKEHNLEGFLSCTS
jgi:hypothetical protein